MFIKGEKIPCITPIVHEDMFVNDFQINSEILNFHFAEECSLLKNESGIPPHLLPHTNYVFKYR